MIRLAVIGAGRIAERVHLPNLARLPGIVVEGVVDPDPDRLRVIRTRWPELAVFDSMDDLLACRTPDAVLVCAPPEHHAELALRALSSHAHLYLEKPVATRSVEAREVADAWRGSSFLAAMGFNYRFHPGVHELVRRSGAGEIGRRMAIRTLFSAPDDGPGGWRSSPSLGGGALLDLGAHHLDLIRFVTGEEGVELTATLSSPRAGIDAASVTLALSDDSMAQCLFILGGPEVDRFEIVGARGVLSLDRLSGRVERSEPRFAHGRRSSVRRATRLAFAAAREAGRPPGEPSYRLALAAFARAVGGSGELLPSLDDGLRALELAEAALESARTGSTVSLRFPVEGEG